MPVPSKLNNASSSSAHASDLRSPLSLPAHSLFPLLSFLASRSAPSAFASARFRFSPSLSLRLPSPFLCFPFRFLSHPSAAFASAPASFRFRFSPQVFPLRFRSASRASPSLRLASFPPLNVLGILSPLFSRFLFRFRVRFLSSASLRFLSSASHRGASPFPLPFPSGLSAVLPSPLCFPASDLSSAFGHSLNAFSDVSLARVLFAPETKGLLT